MIVKKGELILCVCGGGGGGSPSEVIPKNISEG